MLIKLSHWESGEGIVVDPSVIVSMCRLPAMVGKPFGEDDPPRELGARTRVETRTDIITVRETPSEILKMVRASARRRVPESISDAPDKVVEAARLIAKGSLKTLRQVINENFPGVDRQTLSDFVKAVCEMMAESA